MKLISEFMPYGSDYMSGVGWIVKGPNVHHAFGGSTAHKSDAFDWASKLNAAYQLGRANLIAELASVSPVGIDLTKL